MPTADAATDFRGLEDILGEIGQLSVAVSGGVDSTTLAVLAHRVLGHRATMFHAVSPAVPSEATRRVRNWAGREGWELAVIGAGELSDPRYVSNPVNRCFYCKTNLYDAMARHTDGVLVSGTNLDDLNDYRPGLQAADMHSVRHPYVEANIDKRGVRALARLLDLNDLASLPASPCLSSRVETGIAIKPRVLHSIHQAENLLTEALSPRTTRCRVRHNAIVVELDAGTLDKLPQQQRRQLEAEVRECFPADFHVWPVRFEVYQMGSAFLRSGRGD